MMRDSVAEFANAVEPRLDLGTLDRPAREDFDQVIPPEHVVPRSSQSCPEAKGKRVRDIKVVNSVFFFFCATFLRVVIPSEIWGSPYVRIFYGRISG